MEIISQLITSILIIASMIGLFWALVGVPVGIVFVILKLLKKEAMSWKKLLLLFFGGVLLLIASFILFFILSVILAFFGISTSNLSLPANR